MQSSPAGAPRPEPASAPAFHDHFSERAAAYAAHRPSYPEALGDLLASLSPGRELAWDAGCGSGQATALLASRFARVVGTDASAAQLERAVGAPNVEYRRATADASGLPEASVDLALAAQAAHWFDLDAYYAEVSRVARPGGLVALATYGVVRIDPEVDAVLEPFYWEILRGFWPPERRHVEDGYRSLPFPFAELEPPPLEMVADWTLPALLGYVRTWSAVRALEKAGGGEALETLQSALAAVWGQPATPHRVRWPLSLRLGRL